MIFFNSRSLFFVGYWTIFSVATLFGRITDFARDGGNVAEYDYDWDVEMAKRNDRKIKAIMMGSSWLSGAKYHDVEDKGDRNEQNETAKYAGRSESSGGFQWRARKSKPRPPGGRHRATVHPNNATKEPGRQSKIDDLPGVSRTTAAAATTHSVAAAPGGGREVFGDENDCVSANGGRPCVCYMTDFLDSVGQLLDEAKLVRDDTAAAVAAFTCPSYKTVPSAFVVNPWTPSPTATAVRLSGIKSDRKNKNESADVAVAPARKKVDFDYVVNYQLEKSKDDHFRVHYYQLGSDIKIRCVSNKTGIKAFKWQYTKLKSNSTITGTDTNNLSILNLKSEDSKNYTCVPKTEATKGLNFRKNAYTHYVIAIDKPIYEIWGTAFYKTDSGSGCAEEIIDPMIKKLPGFMQTEICPEGSSQHACNVVVESSKCLKNESSLEVKYAVTLKDKANYLTRVRTSKKGQNALFYQKLLAKISNVIAGNLNLTLAVQIKSKYSLIDTHFTSDLSRMNVNKFVSCGPGFGIQEVFCSACPPHHYSPDKSADCLKCSKGFYQPVAGSVKCVKCPNFLAKGCNKINTKYTV